MAEERGGPVLARKRLASALRAHRDRAEYTLDHVASELMISASKLSRLEKSQGLPQLRDVRDLVNFYGLNGTPEAEKLMRWAKDGRRKGWWEEYSQVLTPEQDQYIAHENEATVGRAYNIPFIYGLLQTEDYLRALISTFQLADDPEEVEQLVKTREIRKRSLQPRDGRPPLELHVVLHEACLVQPVGTPEVMASQLQYLITVSEQSNVEVRVLEAKAGSHRAMFGLWQHFSFGEDIDRDVVYLESPSGYTQIEDERKTRLYHRWFDELHRRSLPPDETRDKIRGLL